MIEGTEFIDLTLGGGGSGGGGSSAGSEWVAKHHTIYAYPTNLTVTTSPTEYTPDISDYLPEGATGQYEITGYVAGQEGNFWCDTNIIPNCAGLYTPTGDRYSFIIIMDANNPSLTLRVYTEVKGFELAFEGYRKVTGAGTSNYANVTNKPKLNNVTIDGNKTSSDYGIQDALVSGTNIKTVGGTSLLGSGDVTVTTDVQINGTSVVTSGVANIPLASTSNLGAVKTNTSYGLNTNSSGTLIGVTRAENTYDAADSLMVICKGTLANIQNSYVRAVSPACTVITASSTTATITPNSTYSHKPTTSGLYTVVTPSDSSVYSGFIFQIDTANSASIAFQTDGSPASTIKINGNVTPVTGKKYTVTGQWDVENSSWQLFIIDYSAS